MMKATCRTVHSRAFLSFILVIMIVSCNKYGNDRAILNDDAISEDMELLREIVAKSSIEILAYSHALFPNDHVQSGRADGCIISREKPGVIKTLFIAGDESGFTGYVWRDEVSRLKNLRCVELCVNRLPSKGLVEFLTSLCREERVAMKITAGELTPSTCKRVMELVRPSVLVIYTDESTLDKYNTGSYRKMASDVASDSLPLIFAVNGKKIYK